MKTIITIIMIILGVTINAQENRNIQNINIIERFECFLEKSQHDLSKMYIKFDKFVDSLINYPNLLKSGVRYFSDTNMFLSTSKFYVIIQKQSGEETDVSNLFAHWYNIHEIALFNNIMFEQTRIIEYKNNFYLISLFYGCLNFEDSLNDLSIFAKKYE